MSGPMIQFEAVCKRFSVRAPRALQDLSFEVGQGEIYGLLGHNGAGKSTALGVLLGLIRPDSGDALIGNHSIRRSRAKALRSVGAILESPRFYGYLSGWRNLKVLTAYSGFWTPQVVRETVEWVGLSEVIHRRVASYSHGMRQRLALAQALLPTPRVLILDEPTTGLDPDGILDLRSRIHHLRDRLGLTVLVSSHLLPEVEQVCDRVAILKAGELVFDGRCTELDSDGEVYCVTCGDWDWERIKILVGGLDIPAAGNGKLRIPNGKDPNEVLQAIVHSGIPVREFYRETKSLESLYVEVCGES